jgi:uncharacterized delta-60 repeat protein
MCGRWNTCEMRRSPKLVTLALVLALCTTNTPARANGSTDPNFNNGAIVLQNSGEPQEHYAVALQGNKIITAGGRYNGNDYDFVIARFLATGELDLDFGLNGYVVLDIDTDVDGYSGDNATDLAITSSNDIYVYGTSLKNSVENLAIVKLDEDGTPIDSFGNLGTGILIVDAASRGAEAFTSKDIEIFGNSVYFAAAKRVSNGGGPSQYLYSLDRMSHLGVIDNTFSEKILGGAEGLDISGYLGAMTIDSSGNIYLAGDDNNNGILKARVVKISSSGNLVDFADSGFLDVPIFSSRNPSNQLNAQITQLKISDSGSVFAVGSSNSGGYDSYEVFVLNFNSSGAISEFGALDSTSYFNENRFQGLPSKPSIAIQSDGKFLVSTTWIDLISGLGSGLVARFSSSGVLDPDFGVNGVVDFPLDYHVNAIQIQNNQKVIVTGTYWGNIAGSSYFLSRIRTALPPSSPSIGIATATGSTTASVSFTAPVNNGGSTITSYTINAWNDALSTILKTQTYSSSLPALGASATFTVTGLTPSTVYRFSVAATNSEGDSSQSLATSAVTTSAASSGAGGGGTGADELKRQQEAAAAAKQKQDQELKEILSLVPTIAGLAQGIAGLGNSLLLPKKCVKGKLVKKVKAGAKCPKGYKVRK